MLDLGLIGFANGWVLAGLAALPVIWWLVRATPPAARRADFPALRLLLGLAPVRETPERTPWWLLALRLAVAALIVIGLAGPVLHPQPAQRHDGPLLLVIDDGWAAAGNWEQGLELLRPRLMAAQQAGRPVRLLTTAPTGGAASGEPPLLRPDEALARLDALQPRPWAVDRGAAAARLRALPREAGTDAVWLSDGLDDGHAAELGAALTAIGSVTRIDAAPPGGTPLALGPPAGTPDGFDIPVGAVASAQSRQVTVAARDERGDLLAQAQATIAPGRTAATAAMALPVPVRNKVARLDLPDFASAGAVELVDTRWRRRSVSVAVGTGADRPLVSDSFYIERAMQPFAEVDAGSLEEALAAKPSMIVLGDSAALSPTSRSGLDAYLRGGGMVLRFAGPHLAQTHDDVVPVPLRGGGRVLGGTLAWENAAGIAPFPADSPFAGLPPPAEVKIGGQVLAEPSLDLDSHVWARLTDGTPLVTFARRDKGLLVLVHTTANTDWSNLALSGFFVDMLRRLTELSGEAKPGTGDAVLPPLSLLDGFGRLDLAPAAALGLRQAEIGEVPVGPEHPPGLYGDSAGRRALNLSPPLDALKPIPAISGVAVTGEAPARERPLLAAFLVAGIVLALIDLLAGLMLAGRLRRRFAAVLPAAALGLAALWAQPHPATAQDMSDADDAAQIRLAYVETGDADVDEMTQAGLDGLSDALRDRTAVDAGDPVRLNLETDELSFYPLIYWPIVAGNTPSDAAMERVSAYLKSGGMVLFDTRDAGNETGGVGTGPQGGLLRATLSRLDVPPLIPVPPTHVLTKAFYLLQTFPGRYDNGQLWVEADANPETDGVSSILIGSNDWAAAWAVDRTGQPLAALEPDSPRQRELALRFGINLVMYALTGNYKADQVHVPALLERLDQ